MKHGIIKVKHVKPTKKIFKKFYIQVINDACVRIAVLEICFGKKTRESVVRIFKNALHDFVNKFLKKKYFRKHFKKKLPKTFDMLSRFWPISGWGWEEGVNLLKKKKLGPKSFLDKAE